MCKTSIFKIFFPCLYNFTLPKYLPIGPRYGSGENYPDPTQKVRIQIRIRNPDFNHKRLVGRYLCTVPSYIYGLRRIRILHIQHFTNSLRIKGYRHLPGSYFFPCPSECEPVSKIIVAPDEQRADGLHAAQREDARDLPSCQKVPQTWR